MEHRIIVSNQESERTNAIMDGSLSSLAIELHLEHTKRINEIKAIMADQMAVGLLEKVKASGDKFGDIFLSTGEMKPKPGMYPGTDGEWELTNVNGEFLQLTKLPKLGGMYDFVYRVQDWPNSKFVKK